MISLAELLSTRRSFSLNSFECTLTRDDVKDPMGPL